MSSDDVTGLEFTIPGEVGESEPLSLFRVELSFAEMRSLTITAAEQGMGVVPWIRTTLLAQTEAKVSTNEQVIEAQPSAPTTYHPGVWLLDEEGDRRLLSKGNWERLVKELERHEAELKTHLASDFNERIIELLRTRQRHETKAIADLKAFQEDVLIYLRAIALVIEAIGNAGTHREKDARLRGAIGQIESAIQSIRNNQEQFTSSWWDRPDVFRSDFPVRRYQEQIQALDREVKALRAQLNPEAAAATVTFHDVLF